MKALSIVKAALEATRCGLLAAAPAVQARTGGAVPRRTSAPIAAINAANGVNGAPIKLAPWCAYLRTAASSPNVMPGKLTLPGLSITDGNTPGIGHRSRSAR